MVDKSRAKANLHLERVKAYLAQKGLIISEENKRIEGGRIDFLVRDRSFKYTWVLASALANHATDSLRKQIAYAVLIKVFDPNANIMAVFDYVPGTTDGAALVRALESLGVNVVGLVNEAIEETKQDQPEKAQVEGVTFA